MSKQGILLLKIVFIFVLCLFQITHYLLASTSVVAYQADVIKHIL
jgi:ribonuclease HI